MDYYDEYPIRCFSCHAKIDAYAQTFADLMSDGKKTVRECFEEMGMRANSCCRSALMSPIQRTLVMDNRAVIDGYVDVSTVSEPDPYVRVSRGTTSDKLIRVPLVVDESESKRGILKGEAIKVETGEVAEEPKFDPPTRPGVPTYNPLPNPPKLTIYVGDDRMCTILSGMTYLAV